MAYTNSIPNATDRPSDSQPLIKANFQSIYTVNGINHVQFDDPSGDQGKHKYVSFPLQSASPTTATTEVALFSRTSTLTGLVELAIRKQSDGTVTELTSALKATDGWTILPSGLLLKWGLGTSTTGGLVTFTWNTGATIPVFSSVFHVQVSPSNTSTGDINAVTRIVDFNTTRIRAYNSKRTSTGAASAQLRLSMLAIGLPA